MIYLQFDAQLLIEDDRIDYGLSNIFLVESASGDVVLHAISTGAQTMVSWSVGQSGSLPSPNGVETFDNTELAGLDPLFFEGPSDSLFVAGAGETWLMEVQTGSSGNLSDLTDIDLGTGPWISAASFSDGFIAVGSLSDGFTIFDSTSQNGWAHIAQQNDSPDLYCGKIDLIHSINVNGQNILVTGSSTEGGLSTFHFDGTSLSLGTNIGTQDGTGLLYPADLTSVSLGGTDYLLVASANGSSGVISVFSVNPDGTIATEDQVSDSLASRFGSVQSISATEFNGGALVVCGGGDDGLSLFALNEEGILTHLDAFADTIESGLTNVSEIQLVISGDTLQIFVTSQADPGITIMSVDLGTLGVIGGTANTNGQIEGTALDDVLYGTGLAETFIGSQGSDLYVVTSNVTGQDTITGFDITGDRIDLSNWNSVYSVNSLTITPTRTGAIISFGTEQLIIESLNGDPLTRTDLESLIHFDVTRLPDATGEEKSGSAQNDLIEGSSFQDTLSGAEGNDTLFGYSGDDFFFQDDGDDTLFGGDGQDQMILSDDIQDVILIAINGSTVTLASATGTDVIDGIEHFVFADGELTFEDLHTLSTGEDGLSFVGTDGTNTVVGTKFADTLDGVAGHDSIWGGQGDDNLSGGAGKDVLSGGNGSDILAGGTGDDVLEGGNGNDTISGQAGDDWIDGGKKGDVIYGGDGADELFGDGGKDLIFGGSGSNFISGGKKGDTLYGGDSDDTLTGDNGKDEIYGSEGADWIDGGTKKDFLYGGDGADTLLGDGGKDRIFGGDGSDAASGGRKRDKIYGEAGDDTLDGNGGDDDIFGGDGNDVISGGLGNDTLWGGLGDDILTGNGGGDTFIFEAGDGNDIFTDFKLGLDVVHLVGGVFADFQTVQELVDTYGTLSEGQVVLDFGNAGSLTFDNLSDINSIVFDITIDY